jgi:hypothetical protein
LLVFGQLTRALTRVLTFGWASLAVVYLVAAVCLCLALKAFFPRDYAPESRDET